MMLSVDEALEAILNRIETTEPESVFLKDAGGRIAAQEYRADSESPAFAGSALDGFAVQSRDIRLASRANPITLKVIETVMAGSTAKSEVVTGTAIRIMTGAPLPAGAECVVGFEDVSPEGNRVRINKSEVKDRNVQPAGFQIKKGDLLVERGQAIGPSQLLLLASAGLNWIQVFRRPKVAIIATGSELVAPGRPLGGAQIYSGSAYTLAMLISQWGGIPRILGIAKDTEPDLKAKIRRGSETDFAITIGGVAGGDHDLVNGVIAELGEVVFAGVRMTPGKATTFGQLKKSAGAKVIPHLALSGSPPAALAGFAAFFRPALAKMIGRKDLNPGAIEAVAGTEFENPEALQRYIWVALERREGVMTARPGRDKSKGSLTSIASAGGLAVLPASAQIKQGSLIPVLRLDWTAC